MYRADVLHRDIGYVYFSLNSLLVRFSSRIFPVSRVLVLTVDVPVSGGFYLLSPVLRVLILYFPVLGVSPLIFYCFT